MPTVLCSGRGQLSFGFLLHRCLLSQVIRGQHSCAKDIWGDMTQSWPSQQASAGNQGILFNPTDGKQPTTQQRQGRGDAQPRMTRHAHVAPHKSMLVDDLRLSSDEEDAQGATHESASWEGHSLSHPNGRRARHSSSDSLQSHSSVESVSGSLHSRSSNPAGLPADAQSQCSSNKEGKWNWILPVPRADRSTAAQWQLDKWLKKSHKKAAQSEHYPTRSIPGNPPSPHTLRVPSPARCWDSNQNYSPSQSPIPSPQLSYRPGSPSLSLDYSFCPSPLPSTCPSPSNSRYSPILSPASCVFPSPCGSPRVQHSPKPIHRGPQLSPTSPSLRGSHYPEVQSHLYPAPPPHRTKVRSRVGPLSNSDAKTKHTNSTEPPPHQQRPKARPEEYRDHRQNKSKAVLNCSDSHRPQNHSHPGTKKPAKYISQYEQIQGGRLVHSSDRRTRPPVQHSSQHHLPTSVGQGPTAKAAGKNHLRPGPNVKLWANASKTSNKQPLAKKREVVHREVPHTEAERRKDRRGEEERKEDRRLAEEQLLRHCWIESSAEEEKEEVVVVEKQPRRPREKQQNRECQAIQSKERHRHHDHLQRRTEKRAKQRDSSSSLSPPPQRQPPSPSASSNSDSEYQPQVARAPADSTSLQGLRRRGQNSSGRPDASQSGGKTSESPAEGQQSETRHRLYTLVPFGRSEQAAAPSQRGLRNLVVHIDLCLLKRVPDTAVNSSVKATNFSSSSSSSLKTKDKQSKAMKHLYMPDAVSKDSKRKRKLENGITHKESKRNTPHAKDIAGRTESSLHVAERSFSTETMHNGYLEEYLDSKRPLSPLSPLSDSPESTELTGTSKARNGEIYHTNRDKNRDSALKPKKEVDCIKVSRQSSSDSWGPAGHRAAVPNTETPHHAEYYLHEAKRMKHRADAMVDKLGKAVNYVDAALSFMECGKAMEEGPLEAKSPYTMYAETVDLIRYAMRLKSHSGPGARQEDKQLAVLCFRCLALLYWQMFRLKKDHALKYSKVLLDYFKTSPKVPTMPSCWNDTGKDTGGPSPSLLPNATKHIRRGSYGDSASPSLISIPQRIHQMAANHLNITNSVLYSYEYWEVADNLAQESKEFFNYLNTLSGPLTLHSSVVHAVQYTRQALQWIRISAKLN